MLRLQMMAPVYGLAEQAAAVILAQHNGTPLPGSTTNTTTTASGTNTSKSPAQTDTNNNNVGNKNAAAWTRPHIGFALVALLAGMAAAL